MRPTIRLDEVDITGDVRFSDAQFSSQASGAPGLADLYVRDREHSRGPYATGAELTCDLGSTRIWGGYLRKVTREFPFAVSPTPDHARGTPRYWHLAGSDYNTLLNQRVIYNHINPVLGNVGTDIEFIYNPGSYDDDVIRDIITKYTDLPADGISLTGVQRVGVVVFDVPGITSGKGLKRGSWPEIAASGFTISQMLYTIARNTGAIFYIDPRKVLDYVDVDTVSSPYTLTDQPSGPFDVGYRELEILADGSKLDNDAFVWGTTLGSALVVFARSTDAPSVALHGRWQSGLPTAALYRQASANAVASSYVHGTPTSHRGGKDDRIGFTATVFNTPLVVAQKLRCVSVVEGFDAVYPIRKIDISFPTKDDVKMVAALSWEPDIPWDFSEFKLDTYKYTISSPPVFHWPKPPSGSDTAQLFLDTFDGRFWCSGVSFGVADNDRGENRVWGASGITDSFARPDTSHAGGGGGLGVSDSGAVWVGSGGKNGWIAGDQAVISDGTGSSNFDVTLPAGGLVLGDPAFMSLDVVNQGDVVEWGFVGKTFYGVTVRVTCSIENVVGHGRVRRLRATDGTNTKEIFGNPALTPAGAFNSFLRVDDHHAFTSGSLSIDLGTATPSGFAIYNIYEIFIGGAQSGGGAPTFKNLHVAGLGMPPWPATSS